MNSCELTASVTATANALACRLSNGELADTLITVAKHRAICEKNKRQKSISVICCALRE